MPPETRISKDDILKTAFEIVREEGLLGLSARKLAGRLNCSTKPIYHVYKNMDELTTEVMEKAKVYGTHFIQKTEIPGHPFLNREMGVIHLSSEEKQLFKLLFSTDKIFPEHSPLDQQSQLEMMKQEEIFQGLNDEQLNRILMDMTIYTHGVISMLNHQALRHSECSIEKILERMLSTLIDWEKERS